MLVTAYRVFPVRAHCDSLAGVHALPCRLAVPLLRMADGPRCGDFDG